MVDTARLEQALSLYTGDQETLESFSAVATEELGEDWLSKIMDVMTDLSPELKERLDHAYRYYGAVLSWNELQSYLSQEEPLDTDFVSERLPTLAYWLEFFGEDGEAALQQLEEKLQESLNATDDYEAPSVEEEPYTNEPTNNSVGGEAEVPLEADGANEAEPFYGETTDADDTVQDVYEEPSDEESEVQSVSDEPYSDSYEYPEEEVYDEGVPVQDVYPEERRADNSDQDEATDPEERFRALEADTEEQFMAKKAFRQLDFLNRLQSWINARCIALGNIEIYSYKYYGFLIEVMQETQKDVQAVLSAPVCYPSVEELYPEGIKKLQNGLEALNHDLQVARDNLSSEESGLVSDEMDAQAARRMLGMLDTSNKKEYLGPAPDGFEAIDDPFDTTDTK